jgi:NTE family protein
MAMNEVPGEVPSMRAVLIFYGADGTPALRIRLPEGRSILGSDPACDFVVHLPGMAPRHLELEHFGDRVGVRALDAVGEMRINGTALVEHWLVDGDSIEMGTNFRVEFGRSEVDAPPAPSGRRAAAAETVVDLEADVAAAASHVSASSDEPESSEQAFRFLRSLSLFYTMSDDHLRRIAEAVRLRRFSAGEAVVRQGEPGEAFYLVRSGRLEVVKNGERVLALGPDQFFGEVALLTNGVRAAGVVAVTPCELYEVDRACFDSTIRSNLRIAKHFLRLLAGYGEDRRVAQRVLEKMAPAQPRVGVALAAGGAGGLVELGVLKVLEEEGIPIHMIAGCSMGAQIGATYALTGSYQATYELFARATKSPHLIRRWTRDFSWLPWRGLIKGDKVLEMFREAAGPNDDFSKLKIPFRAVATNLDTGREVIFKEGPVGLAVRASISLPALFEPVEIGGHRYVDGGIVNPLPVNVLAQEGLDVIIAVLPNRTGACEGGGRSFWTGNFFSVLTSSLTISVRHMLAASARIADVTIAPDADGVGVFDAHRLDELIAIGEQTARGQMGQIRERLGR